VDLADEKDLRKNLEGRKETEKPAPSDDRIIYCIVIINQKRIFLNIYFKNKIKKLTKLQEDILWFHVDMF
jgi:hypothetical protein